MLNDTLAAPDVKEVVQSGHWLGQFVQALLTEYQTAEGLTFEKAESLLAAHQQQFEKDIAFARRMYQLYPDLITSQVSQDQPETPVAAAATAGFQEAG